MCLEKFCVTITLGMAKEKILYKGRVISLLNKKTRLPNGFIVDLDIIRHPGAVLAVPFVNHEKIVLLRQYRPVVKTYLWELPAGTLKRAEKPSSCVRREIIEETGFKAKKIRRLGEIFPVPGYSTEKITIFRATGLSRAEPETEEDEVIEVCFAGKKQVQRLFKQGKIRDAKTICALAMCGWLR